MGEGASSVDPLSNLSWQGALFEKLPSVPAVPSPLLQVRSKALALVQFLGQQHGAQRTYALLTLANKLLSQCEVQVCGLIGGVHGE